MTWYAKLALNYRREAERTALQFAHEGPLRVLQSLYAEGPGVCHNVLVHPPGGLVGGDTLDVDVQVGQGAHALITTPGATRFYRSTGERALQQTRVRLDSGARLEWLPLEAILYSGCLAENRLTFDLAPGAELMGWDVTALGLPWANLPFERGTFCQHIEYPGVWLERGVIDSQDDRLLGSGLGLDGQQCLATIWLACGSPMERSRRELGLEVARQCLAGHPLAARSGATSPHAQVLVLRVLAAQVEPAMQLLRTVWGAWRQSLWGLTASPPRIWGM